MYGQDDALKYVNGYKSKVQNQQPIISPARHQPRPAAATSTSRARSFSTPCAASSNDDARWWTLIHDFYQHFKYQNIMTEDVVAYFNQQTGMNLTPIFDQYLRHAALPVSN